MQANRKHPRRDGHRLGHTKNGSRRSATRWLSLDPPFVRRALDLLDERHGGPLGWQERAGFDSSDAAPLTA
jgi:hypothetical protein